MGLLSSFCVKMRKIDKFQQITAFTGNVKARRLCFDYYLYICKRLHLLIKFNFDYCCKTFYTCHGNCHGMFDFQPALRPGEGPFQRH